MNSLLFSVPYSLIAADAVTACDAPAAARAIQLPYMTRCIAGSIVKGSRKSLRINFSEED
jgi:hypothetical protein